MLPTPNMSKKIQLSCDETVLKDLENKKENPPLFPSSPGQHTSLIKSLPFSKAYCILVFFPKKEGNG